MATPGEATPGEAAIADRERLLSEMDFVECLKSNDNSPNLVRCKGCGMSFSSQAVRIRAHHLRIEGRGVKMCTRRPTTVNGHPVDVVKILQPIEDKYQDLRTEKRQRKAEANAEKELREANAKRRRCSEVLPAAAAGQGRLLTRSLPAVSTKEEVDHAWALCFLASGVEHTLIENPLLRDAVQKTMQCPGYTFMKRQTIGKTYAPLIEAEVRENYLTRLKSEAQRFGIAQAADGVSNRKIPWMAFLCLFPGVSLLHKYSDCTGITKSMQWLCDMHVQVEKELCAVTGEEDLTILLLEDGGCRDLKPLWEAAMPFSTFGLCAPHSLDLYLKTCCNYAWALPLRQSSKTNCDFIMGHQKSLAWFKEAAAELCPTGPTAHFPVGHEQRLGLMPTQPSDVRMATHLLNMMDEIKLQAAFVRVVTMPAFLEWLRGKKYKDMGLAVREDVLNNPLFEEKKAFVTVLMPVMKLLRWSDSVAPMMDRIYYELMMLGPKIKDAIFAIEDETFPHERHDQMDVDWKHRHVYMHNRMMAAGYALNPENADVDFTACDAEVLGGLEELVLRLFYKDPYKATLFMMQFQAYQAVNSPYKQEMRRQFAAAQPSYKYWATFGGRNGMLLTVTDENQKYIGGTIGEKVPPPPPLPPRLSCLLLW